MPVKRGVKKGASSKVKKKAVQAKPADAKRETSAGTSAAPARDSKAAHGAQPGAGEPGSNRGEKGVLPADLQATTQRRQKLAEEIQTVEKQVRSNSSQQGGCQGSSLTSSVLPVDDNRRPLREPARRDAGTGIVLRIHSTSTPVGFFVRDFLWLKGDL
jgi:hypothetical protein